MKLGLTYHLAFKFKRARQAYEEGFALWKRAGTSPVDPLPPAPHPLRLQECDPVTLDPTMSIDTTSGGIIQQLFSGLVTLNAELDVVPELAQSWEVLEGGRSYIFHLRDDARWSDEVPVTAEDFVYAYRVSQSIPRSKPNAAATRRGISLGPHAKCSIRRNKRKPAAFRRSACTTCIRPGRRQR